MSDDRDLEAWKRARAADAAPRGFSDRVMAAVAAEPRAADERVAAVPSSRGGLPRALARLAGSAPARVAAVFVAALLFLTRLASLFAVFAAR